MCKKTNHSPNICSLCGRNVSGAVMFCSEECMEVHYDYVLLDVSKRWVHNTLLKIPCPERYSAIVAFGKRHKYSLKLLKKKLSEKFKIDICEGNR